MRDIKPILQSLGLLDSEIKVYLASFGHGPDTANEIAKKAKLSRQAVYTAIDALTAHGLMTWVMSGKKRLYTAESPQNLLQLAQARIREIEAQAKNLEAAIPELELQMGGERPVVRIYEGKEGLSAIMKEMTETKAKRAFEITDVAAMQAILTENDREQLRASLRGKGVEITGFYAGQISPNALAKQHHILKEKDFKANIGVYGDRIILVTFEGKLHSAVVESKALARTMTILFELANKK